MTVLSELPINKRISARSVNPCRGSTAQKGWLDTGRGRLRILAGEPRSKNVPLHASLVYRIDCGWAGICLGGVSVNWQAIIGLGAAFGLLVVVSIWAIDWDGSREQEC